MSWRAHLQLKYTLQDGRCVGHSTHVGPLRVLKSLYPEGPAICHHVLVHPPGGVVGGDELHVDAHIGTGAHAVLTTPGATRFYRSEGAPALQKVALHAAAGARVEWLPLETIAHPGCIAENRLQLHLQPGSEAIAWDTLVLGLPASGEAFASADSASRFQQHMEVPGQWLERGLLRADDTTLLQSPLGLAGQPVMATLGFFSGSPLPAARRDALLEAARQVIADCPLPAVSARAGATAPQPGVVLLRLLAPKVEPAMALLRAVRAAWRQQAWGLAAEPPRIWRT